MPQITSGAITATAAAICTARAYNGAAGVGSLQIICASVTGATYVTFTVYDNNAAASVTTGAGATWSGKSPGYSGQGPGTSIFQTENFQSARYGDQQGQTAPNSAGVKQYWPVTLATGDQDLTAAPTVKTTGTILADGNASFVEIDNTSATGNVVAAVTAARALWSCTLQAGQAQTWTPTDLSGVSFGVNIVAAASGMTALAGTYNMTYIPLP